MRVRGHNVFLALAAFTFLVGAPKANAAASDFSDLFGDPALARGKGVEIKRSALDDAYIALKANRAARNERLNERDRRLQEAQLLDRLTVTQLMINRATAGDRAAAAVLAEKFMAEAKKAALSEDAFQVQLKAMGMSMEAFNKRVMDQALSESVLERELKSTINITDAQTRDFYDTGTDLIIKLAEADVAKLTTNAALTAKDLAEGKSRIEDMKKANLERLQRPERVKVAHILLITRDRETDQPLPEDVVKEKRKQIEQLRDRAQKGEDFSELIKKYSEDRGVKETGGIYTLSQAEPFAPEFKAAAFSLTTNQISDVVQTVVGFHVIKQLERLPAKKSTYDEVKKDLKEFLTQQEYQRLMPEYFDKLKKEAQVEILDAKYNIEEAIKAAREGR